MASRPRHADIAHGPTRALVAWFFVTARCWQGDEVPKLSTAEAEAEVPPAWMEAIAPEAPLTAGALRAHDARLKRADALRPEVRAALPGFPPPTWLRGTDGVLYPARRADVVALVDGLIVEFPEASAKALARLIGCSHSTVGARRRARAEAA